MPSAFESGQTFLAGVLAKLPAEKRAQVKDIFDDAEAKDAVTLLGDGTLARSDYSKNLDALKSKETDLNAKFTELNTWWEVNQAALREYPSLKEQLERGGGGNGHGNGNPPKPPDDQPDPRSIAMEVVNEAGRDYVQVSAWLAGKAVQHQHLFNEALDTMAIVQNPKLGKPIANQPGRVYSLDDAYNELHGERVRTKQKEAYDKGINDEVEKRLAEERKKLITQPFPLRGEASALDQIGQKDQPAHTLDTAIAEYERLAGARGA